MSQNKKRAKSDSTGSIRGSAKRFTLPSRQARMAVVIVGFALYVVAFLLLEHRMGPSVASLALFPVATAAWLYGRRGDLFVSAPAS